MSTRVENTDESKRKESKPPRLGIPQSAAPQPHFAEYLSVFVHAADVQQLNFHLYPDGKPSAQKRDRGRSTRAPPAFRLAVLESSGGAPVVARADVHDERAGLGLPRVASELGIPQREREPRLGRAGQIRVRQESRAEEVVLTDAFKTGQDKNRRSGGGAGGLSDKVFREPSKLKAHSLRVAPSSSSLFSLVPSLIRASFTGPSRKRRILVVRWRPFQL